tara:strand:- start:18 stop:404 length:387 start_codon:yes stop_codon:yes gene_type:complete
LRSQLLCTFAHRNDIELVADYISKSYTITEKRMFVFSDANSKSELYITYNVQPDDYSKTPNTIMIHRKKETNTLYTVNALNAIIKKANNGVLDKKFIINWPFYENSLLLTDGDELRHIHLDLHKRIDL